MTVMLSEFFLVPFYMISFPFFVIPQKNANLQSHISYGFHLKLFCAFIVLITKRYKELYDDCYCDCISYILDFLSWNYHGSFRKRTKLNRAILKDQLELERLKHENFLLETEKLKVEVEKMEKENNLLERK
ncbi:hypothetical protein AAHB53_20470 [Niallia circulans]